MRLSVSKLNLEFLIPHKGENPDDPRFQNGAIEHYFQEIGRLMSLAEENSFYKEKIEKEIDIAMEILRNFF